MDSPRAWRRALARVGLVYFAASTVLLVAPAYALLGNHVEPRVLGLPWSLVYVLIVVALNCGALALLYVLRCVDDREHDDEGGG
ncbi:MAG: hypothetical protein IPH07_22405 [Deltaproteobacteria bacterium]|nr:hypothetical protein [Deltaproteobacteria bacterium]MBK8714272.1 hypothetical protein [Deltaproteobacteria bacterium]MBP7285938.1 hypothetical protein [Nannocystaceae bacterium]